MRVSRLVGVLLVLLLTGIGVGTYIAVDDYVSATSPEKMTGTDTIAALRARDFDRLERGFSLPTATARAFGHSGRRGFGQFSNSDPELREALDAWVEARPASPQAYLARGTYFDHLGGLSRGDAYISETTVGRLRQMRHYYDLAAADFKAALALREDLEAAYFNLIYIARAFGDREAIDALRRQGLDAMGGDNPRIHFAYLRTLEPKWGGAEGQWDHYVATLTRRFKDDPEYAWIFAFLLSDQALDLADGGDPEAALLIYDEAQEVFETAWTHRRKGNAYLKLEREEEALAAFERALELDPEDAWSYHQIGLIHLWRGELETAREYLDRAIAFDPYNWGLLSERIDSLEAMLRLYDGPDREQRIMQTKADILEALDRLLVYASAEPHFHWARGNFFQRLGGSWSRAAQSYKRAVDLAPHKPTYWHDYAVSLYQTRDCAAMAASETYLELCREDEDCQVQPMWPSLIRQHLDWCAIPKKQRPEGPRDQAEEAGLSYKRCGGVATAENKETEVENCRALAEAGDGAAQYDMGLILVQGKHAVLDYKESLAWFARAAEQGDSEAVANLGGMYFRGIGVEANRARGIALWRQAAEAGVPAARLELAMAYFHGAGLEQDKTRAESMLRALADEGFVPARRQLYRLFQSTG